MKNLFKKIGALLVAAVMVLSMCTAVFADDTETKVTATGTASDKGTITVKGVDAETDADGKSIITVKAYPIVEATYANDSGEFTGYNNKYSIVDIENPSVDELSAIASKNDLGAGITLTFDAKKDAYVATNQPVGMYLICVTGAEAKVYNVAVASINYENSEGHNVLKPGDVTMTKDIDVASGVTWVKKSDAPDVEKKITSSATKTENGLGGTQKIGSVIEYTVTVNPIPDYSGNHPKLNVVDTLSAGLTYVPNSLAVKIGNTVLNRKTETTEGAYTLVEPTTDNGNKLTVDFVVDGAYTLNSYKGQAAVITYRAKLNENAVVNENANINSVKLNYTKDSKTEGNDGEIEKKTYTYTFELDGEVNGKGIVTKVGEGENFHKLPGATFGLYTDEACNTLYTNDVFTGTAVSGENGELHMKGLAAGTYYLKEISAPEGYSINTKVYPVVIAATYYDNGMLKTWSVTIDGNEAANFSVANDATVTGTPAGYEIKNTKLSSLPSTGGMGTYLFTIIGVVVMAGAAGAFFISRRKGSEE